MTNPTTIIEPDVSDKPPRVGLLGLGSHHARALRAGELPCKWCGRGVLDGVVEMREIEGVPTRGGDGPRRGGYRLATSLCADCTELRENAAAILASHPQIARESGDAGAERVTAVLLALAAVGDRRGQLAATLTSTDDTLRSAIASLAVLGAAATWSRRPVPNECEAYPWNVTEELRGNIREAYRELIAKRYDVVRPIAPPETHGALRGCGFCGVGTVNATNVWDAWGGIVVLPTEGLGGPHSPEPLSAYLCPVCRRSLEDMGAVGEAAVGLAAARHRGYERTGSVVRMGTLAPAWALDPAAPNRIPFGHTNIGLLDTKLGRSRYVYRVGAAQ